MGDKSSDNIFVKALLQLRLNHKTIEQDVINIEQVLRSYPAVKPLLRLLQEKLFNHFYFLGREWFQDLQKNDFLTREQLKALDSLTQDLKEMKVRALIFFDDFPADMGDVHPINFPKRFMDFSKDILARFRVEENYLIPLLEAISAENR